MKDKPINGSNPHLKIVPRTKSDKERCTIENVNALEHEVDNLLEVIEGESTRLSLDLKKAVFELGLSHSFIMVKLMEINSEEYNETNIGYQTEQRFLESLKRNGLLGDYTNYVKKTAGV